MPPSATPSSFLSNVRNSIGTMHPAEKKLADFILDFPGELASYTASELAHLAGVSNASVTRFIKRIGYQSYDQARRHVREEKQAGSPLFLADRSAKVTGVGLAAHVEQAQENLRRTFARISEETVTDIAQRLVGARKVWVTGFRASRTIANYFQWQLFQLKEDVMNFPAPGSSFGEYVASIRPEDVIVVFGLRRRPAVLRGLLERFTETGAAVLFVTDEFLAHNRKVTWHLQCAGQSPSPLDNHGAALMLCNVLVSAVIEKSGNRGRQRLAKADAWHESTGEF